MAIIISDPTNLISGGDTGVNFLVPIVLNTTDKTITITPGSGVLPAAADGITGQALYSALKILWKNNATYIKLPFPMESITPEQFEFKNGWTLANDITRKALRTCGWAERNASGTITAMFAGVISLGSLGASDQPYFQQVGASTTAESFAFMGAVNEAVRIYSDPNGDGSFADGYDRRSYLKLFAREQQKTYAAATLGDIGVESMTYICYRFPLANAADLKVLADDTTIESQTAIYNGITVTYYATNQTRTIGGIDYNFNVIVNGNNKTAEQIYTKVQYLLRSNADIDSGPGAQNGNISDALLRFIGDSLITSPGVYIDNFDSNDTNRITFTDVTATGRTFPFVAAGTILFNSNLVNDSAAIYRMFFTTNPAGDYGSTTAVTVKDASGIDIAGLVQGSASIPFSFGYDSNVQGGRTPSTNADVTVVAIGLTTGQYVSASSTLTRSTGQNISLVAALERVYNNN